MTALSPLPKDQKEVRALSLGIECLTQKANPSEFLERNLLNSQTCQVKERYLAPFEPLNLSVSATSLRRSIELIYLLEGALEFKMGKLSHVLEAGAFLVADQQLGNVKLKAVTPLRYLHFNLAYSSDQIGRELSMLSSDLVSLRLLFARSDQELMYVRLKQGEPMFLSPHEVTNTDELYYILEGSISSQDEALAGLRLKAGDVLRVKNLASDVMIKAETDLRYLYFASAPSFNGMSHELLEFQRLAEEVEAQDGYTSEHCRRIQGLAIATGQTLGLSSERLHTLSIGAYLHDLGKIKVPKEILQKPAALSSEEWQIIKRHPSFGAELLEGSSYESSAIIVAQHHERLDGSGYPLGLQGNEILTGAYIVAVADTYDAMTTDRPYRKALSQDTAFAELRRFAGIHYPELIVDAFILSRQQAFQALQTSSTHF